MDTSARTAGVPVEVSVVVPVRNGIGTIAEQLAALAAQRTRYTFEVVVADNGSTDGTAEVVRAWTAADSRFRLVDASRAAGINVGRNVGTAAAGGELICLCDADDVVAAGWLEALADGVAAAGAAGGRLERATLNPEYVRRWGVEPEDWDVVEGDWLPRPVGANCGFRKSIWHELGGFDERYRGGGDDAEFFWRLQLAGHGLQVVPEAVVHYRLRSSAREMVRQSYVYGTQFPMLYRDFRSSGMPWRWRQSLRTWLWSLSLVPRSVLGGRPMRLEMRLQLAQRWGHLVGSIRHRVLYL